MAGKLAIFFVLGVVYFYIIYYIEFTYLKEIVNELPTQINWTNRRKQLMKGINQWTTESLFNNQKPYGYKYINPTTQYASDPQLYALDLINELSFVEHAIIYGNDDEGISHNEYRSSQHDDLIFENACLAEQDRGLDN